MLGRWLRSELPDVPVVEVGASERKELRAELPATRGVGAVWPMIFGGALRGRFGVEGGGVIARAPKVWSCVAVISASASMPGVYAAAPRGDTAKVKRTKRDSSCGVATKASRGGAWMASWRSRSYGLGRANGRCSRSVDNCGGRLFAAASDDCAGDFFVSWKTVCAINNGA